MTKARELADLIANVNHGSSLANKNLIINGKFDVAQRGTSIAGIENYTLDRWKIDRANVDNWAATVSQDSSVPSGYGFANSLKVQTTTAESALADDEYGIIEHIIEAQNLQGLQYETGSSKPITLSFWVKSNVTGTYCNSLYHYDGNDMVNSTYTINSANTWEKKTVTYAGSELADSTIDDNNEAGIKINWILFSGADQKGTSAATWASYTQAMFAHGHDVNIGASTDNYWQITGVQLEIGEKATAFEHEPYETTLHKCQRYYYKHVEGSSYMMGMGDYYVDAQLDCVVHLPVTMRAVPSLVQNSGTNYYLAYGGATAEYMTNAWNLWTAHENVFSLYAAPASNGTAGQARRVITNNSAAMIAMNAEL